MNDRPPMSDSRLDAWLEDGPTSGPDDGLSNALARTRSTRQRPGWLVDIRGDPMETTWRARPLPLGRVAFLALTTLLAAAIIGLALAAGARLLPPPTTNLNAVPVIPKGDEALLAFASWDANHSTSEIYTVRADGTDGRRITSGDGHRFSPAWSPDGSRLAYYSKLGSHTDLRVSSAKGEPLVLASDQGCFPSTTAPAWSPDGRYLLYLVDRDPTDGSCDDLKSDVYVVPSDGSAPGRRLLAASFTPWSSMPAWHDDRIVFRGGEDETTGSLWIAPVTDPATPWDLTPTRLDHGNPADAWGFAWPRWSPDGSAIATTFISQGTGFGNAVTMAADGTTTHALWADPTVDNIAPDWSPDGSHLSLLVLTRQTDQYGVYELATAGPQGQDPVVIQTPELNGNGGPAMISPDGTRAAARTLVAGDATPGHILIAALDGSAAPVEITASQWSTVAWQPVVNADNPAANAPTGLPEG
ncbi:MAG: hypothetical protein U0869_02740 [Chloroflexota bacterium]